MTGPGLAILFAFMLGTASIFSRRGLETGSYRVLLGLSLLIGTVLFLAITAVTTGFADTPVRGVALAAVGAVVGSVLTRALYFLGINYLGPGKALSINATSPLYAAVLAWFVLDETITPLVIGGTLAVVVGILVLSRDVRAQTDREGRSIAVVAYPLLAAIFAAISVTVRKLALDTGILPIEAVTVNMVVGLLVVAPLFATRWRGELSGTNRTALWNFGIAGTLMAIGFAFYFEGLRITDASVFFPLIQTQPLFAVALSAAFLGRLEVITRWTVFGSIIIVGGAALVVIG